MKASGVNNRLKISDERVVESPFVLIDEFYGVFIVDISSPITIISSDAARKMGVTRSAAPESRRGPLLNGCKEKCYLKSALIGDIRFTDLTFAIKDISRRVGVAGIIGISAFKGLTVSKNGDKIEFKVSMNGDSDEQP